MGWYLPSDEPSVWKTGATQTKPTQVGFTAVYSDEDVIRRINNMCQICSLVLRSQNLSKTNSQLLNPKPLSVLITLNQQSYKLNELKQLSEP